MSDPDRPEVLRLINELGEVITKLMDAAGEDITIGVLTRELRLLKIGRTARKLEQRLHPEGK
jgi:hypothetical protein